jgi:hypothetical protein
MTPRLRAVTTPAAERAPLHGSGQRAKPCSHDVVTVDPRERRVTCDDCSLEIDPYEALHHLAQDIDRYEYTRQRARDQARVAREQLAELARVERNVKARIRTGVKRAPVCECETNRYRTGSFCPACGGRIPKAS